MNNELNIKLKIKILFTPTDIVGNYSLPIG